MRKIYDGHLTDSTRWDHVPLRDGDVIVATPPKCGTTWMQTIVALLLSGDPDVVPEPATRMPWVDIRMRPVEDVAARLEVMDHRRSMKSHTPLDGLPVQDGVTYLSVFRHPLDAHLSFRRHAKNISVDLPGAEGGVTFDAFLAGAADGKDMDAAPLAHIVRHYTAAKALADRANVALFHYADMLRDLAGAMARVAGLLGLEYDAGTMAALEQAAGFENMKANADRYAPGGGTGFYKSDAGFFHAGRSGAWRDALNAEDIAAYDAAMDALLPPEERAWLEWGSG